MKDKGLYKHGMYGDRDSMGKKAVHRKMGEYFPKQSSQLTEDGMAIDASRTPGMEMYEAGMAQVSKKAFKKGEQHMLKKSRTKKSGETVVKQKPISEKKFNRIKEKNAKTDLGPHGWMDLEGKALPQTEEEPNPNQAKSGKIYTDEQIASMSDRKKIRKGLAAGVESEGFNPTEKAYKFTLGGKIKTETYDVGGGETVSFNSMRNKNPNFKIGGNPDPEGGGSADLNFGPPSADLPKINFGGSYKYPKSNKNAHYLKKDGSWRSAKSISRRNKKGFNW